MPLRHLLIVTRLFADAIHAELPHDADVVMLLLCVIMLAFSFVICFYTYFSCCRHIRRRCCCAAITPIHIFIIATPLFDMLRRHMLMPLSVSMPPLFTLPFRYYRRHMHPRHITPYVIDDNVDTPCASMRFTLFSPLICLYIRH